MDLTKLARKNLPSAQKNQSMIEKILEKNGIRLIIKYQCIECEDFFETYEEAMKHAKVCR
jgi:hypothetical protein